MILSLRQRGQNEIRKLHTKAKTVFAKRLFHCILRGASMFRSDCRCLGKDGISCVCVVCARSFLRSDSPPSWRQARLLPRRFLRKTPTGTMSSSCKRSSSARATSATSRTASSAAARRAPSSPSSAPKSSRRRASSTARRGAACKSIPRARRTPRRFPCPRRAARQQSPKKSRLQACRAREGRLPS